MSFRTHLSKPSRGFTLIELMVTMTISLVIFGTGFTLLNYIATAQKQASVRVRASENARLFFQLLERDLAASQTGPLGLTKTAGAVPASYPIQVVPPNTTPPSQPIILYENNLSGGTYDILQFYTRADAASVTDEYVFVRYFMDRTNRTLCRQVIPASLDLSKGLSVLDLKDLPELTEDPRLETAPVAGSGLQFALFDEVDLPYKGTVSLDADTKTALPGVVDDLDRVFFKLKHWFPDNKKFDDATASNPATHLEVTLQMRYVLQGDTVLRSRTFTKVFELPW